MTISRREFLKTAVGAGMAACLGPLTPVRIAEANNRKVKEFRFKATESRINLGGKSDFKALTYNGQTPGPEIRVKEGETIRVVLENNLPEPTTIHWHGIPLQNQMDGVPGLTQKAVAPGQKFTYEFEARPAGSFLYHSHAKYQLDQGLYGPLIIEAARPAESYDREYTLTLEDWVMRDGGGTAAADQCLIRDYLLPAAGRSQSDHHPHRRQPDPAGGNRCPPDRYGRALRCHVSGRKPGALASVGV